MSPVTYTYDALYVIIHHHRYLFRAYLIIYLLNLRKWGS